MKMLLVSLSIAASVAACMKKQNMSDVSADRPGPRVGLPVMNPVIEICSGILKSNRNSVLSGSYSFEMSQGPNGKYATIELRNRSVGTYSGFMKCGQNRLNQSETICEETEGTERYLVTLKRKSASVSVMNSRRQIIENLGSLNCGVEPAVGLPFPGDEPLPAQGLPIPFDDEPLPAQGLPIGF